MPEYKVHICLDLPKELAPRDKDGFHSAIDMTIGGIHARNETAAKAKALVMLKYKGFVLVNDDDLVMEVERVYETRWDCKAKPRGARLRKVA